MTHTAVYEVSPLDERWQVKRRGNDHRAPVFDTKPEAVEAAHWMAGRNTPSEVVVNDDRREADAA